MVTCHEEGVIIGFKEVQFEEYQHLNFLYIKIDNVKYWVPSNICLPNFGVVD